MEHRFNTVINKPKRIEELDIMKGLGIICMVIGHCVTYGKPIHKFIYLFHMAIFFMASGYVCKINSIDTGKSLIKSCLKKVSQLYIPYVLYLIAYVLLHNIFIKMNIYTDNPSLLELVPQEYNSVTYSLRRCVKSLVLCGESQIGDALWFVRILFIISIIYLVSEYVLKKLKINKVIIGQTIIAIIFLILGYYCSLTKHSLIFGFDKVLSCYILFHLGRIFKELGILTKKYEWYFHIASFILSFVILLILNTADKNIELSQNFYINPIYLLLASFVGWIFVYEISYGIVHLKSIKKVFLLLGQNTFAIVALHFLCFRLVNYIGVIYQGKPHFLIASHPVLYYDGFWWIAYILVGLSIPVALSLAKKSIKKAILNKLKKPQT